MIYSGLRAWIWQRLSAVVLAAGILAGALWNGWDDYQSWRTLVSQPWGAALLGLLSGALLAHSWVGMRDIILDYVAPRGLRYTLLAALALWLIFLGCWVLIILTRSTGYT